MPAVLTHKSIMLLARQRLEELRDQLQSKIGGGATVTDLEHRMLYLARKAHEMMTLAGDGALDVDFPTGAAYATPLGRGVSPFAVMGSMGPDITAFSALLAPGQAWVFDIVHKGNPDQNRERVVARTTDLALAIWQKASAAIDLRPENDATALAAKNSAKAAARAYVLGHLCHIAGDVLSHPYVNDLEWHGSAGSREKFPHAGGEAAIDGKVAIQVLRRTSLREGQAWSKWWPTLDAVPPELFSAYDAALEEVYQARRSRPAGFGNFEKVFTDRKPPTLDAAFVRDGYAAYRGGVLPMGYDWGYWSWFGFLTPLMVPLLALCPLTFALPKAKLFTQKVWHTVDDERAFSELLSLPIAMSAFPALFYSSWIAGVSARGIEGLTWSGVGMEITSLVAAIVFFATLGVDDLPWWFRWFVLFGLPASFGLYFGIQALANGGDGEGGRRAIALIHTMPLMVGALFFIVFILLAWGVEGIADAAGADEGAAQGIGSGVMTGLFMLGVLLTWFLLPPHLRDAKIPEHVAAFPVERPHFVRLFDDTTLWHEARIAAPTLADRHYPAAQRELLKLWWEGTGDLFVRSRRTHLEIRLEEQGAITQVIPAPITPMNVSEYADFLSRTVRDRDTSTGKLKAALVYATDVDLLYDLPTGATFADVSEAPPPGAAHDDDVAAAPDDSPFAKLKKTQDSADYVLRHAPKSMQAVRFGRRGPVSQDLREHTVVDGPGKIRSNALRVFGFDTRFEDFFAVGDQITAAGQTRLVTRIVGDGELWVSSPFAANLDRVPYQRAELLEESSDGYTYVSNPVTAVLGGEAVMDYAGDFAALLCMGAVPHLLPLTELSVDTLAGRTAADGSALDPALGKIHQVLRNWNLDRRRVNEWRMIVSGGALSEKGVTPEAYDAAMHEPRDPAWRPGVTTNEHTLRALGWVPTLRAWARMAARHDHSAIDGLAPAAGVGFPPNQELSRALAYLFDMPDPVALNT